MHNEVILFCSCDLLDSETVATQICDGLYIAMGNVLVSVAMQYGWQGGIEQVLHGHCGLNLSTLHIHP